LASDQPAQLGEQEMPDAMEAAALGQPIKAPSWTLRIEGRLLEVSLNASIHTLIFIRHL
jgi:hypothetical protein